MLSFSAPKSAWSNLRIQLILPNFLIPAHPISLLVLVTQDVFQSHIVAMEIMIVRTLLMNLNLYALLLVQLICLLVLMD